MAALVPLCALAVLAACPSPALADGAQPASSADRSALLVFVPTGERQLEEVPGLSVGIMSASQGRYSSPQLLLDITQGARIATSAYHHPRPPGVTLVSSGAGGDLVGWPAVVRRAHDVPQLLTPGLLASRVPSGAAYAGISGAGAPDAAAAADSGGHIASVSIGSAASLLARIESLRRRERLVVADLAGGTAGQAQLRALAARRSRGELLVVVERTADQSRGALVWAAAAGLAGGGGRELTSHSTQERGLIAAVDLAPTILTHLGVRGLPGEIRGRGLETDGTLHGGSLRSFMARLRVVGERRLRALGVLLCAWALLLLGCARWARLRAWAMRVGALALLWAPVAVLVPAAFAPGAGVEYATVTLCCLALGGLTEALVPWPRALIAPAIVAVAALSTDALAHTQLLVRSLLGPDPVLGARFYGWGNELKSGLAVLVLGALAGALYPARPGRLAVLAAIGCGALLAAVEGSARIGAGVGGVILVSAGFAIAAVMLTPGALTRRRALIVLVSPVLALVALALLDLLTAHGTGHYTGSILHARSAGDLRDVIVRRYRAAWGELHNHAMPVATALALVAAVVGLRRRARLLAPVGGDPGWLAALAGGLAAGLIGALSEDSGPVLLVVAVFALGCTLTYLWGRPPARNPGDRHAAARAGARDRASTTARAAAAR